MLTQTVVIWNSFFEPGRFQLTDIVQFRVSGKVTGESTAKTEFHFESYIISVMLYFQPSKI